MASHSIASKRSGEYRVLDGQRKSLEASLPQSSRTAPGVTHITIHQSTTPVVISRVKSESNEEDRISTKAVIGTLLGASAGAAIAYAMVKSEDDLSKTAESRPAAYRTVELPSRDVTETAVVIEPASNGRSRRYEPRTTVHRVEVAEVPHVVAGPRVSTLVSSNDGKREAQTGVIRSIPPLSSDSSARTIAQTRNTKVLAGSAQSQASRPSQATSRELSRHESRKSSPPTTTSRIAEDIPLPASRTNTVLSREDREVEEAFLDVTEGTIAPDDSISQVSTNVPEKQSKPKSRHSHRSRHKSECSHGKGGSRTVRAPASKAESTRRRSILGIPLRPKLDVNSRH